MQKGSGLLWALERRGAMQIARILLLAGLDGSSRGTPAPVPARAGSHGGRRAAVRRPRTATPLRLVLP